MRVHGDRSGRWRRALRARGVLDLYASGLGDIWGSSAFQPSLGPSLILQLLAGYRRVMARRLLMPSIGLR